MLVNLVGPPASFKTGLMDMFCEEHTDFTPISIDNLRMTLEEEDAWYQLMLDAVASKFCIVESSGLSWKLRDHILCHPTLTRRGILNIILYGNEELFLQRLKNRKKEEVPFKYKNLSQEGLIKKCCNELEKTYTKGYFLHITEDRSKEDLYKEFKEVINKHKKLLERFG